MKEIIAIQKIVEEMKKILDFILKKYIDWIIIAPIENIWRILTGAKED